jgi:hypothetical protein
MRGFIRRRGPSWELRVYLGAHPVTGRKQYATRSVRGPREHAERVLRDMVLAASGTPIHQRHSMCKRRSCPAPIVRPPNSWVDYCSPRSQLRRQVANPDD